MRNFLQIENCFVSLNISLLHPSACFDMTFSLFLVTFYFTLTTINELYNRLVNKMSEKNRNILSVCILCPNESNTRRHPININRKNQQIFTFEKLEQKTVLFFFFFWFIVLAIQKWMTLMPERWGVDMNTETFEWRCFSFYLTPPPSFCSTPRPFSSYSALLSQKESLSFMMLASTAPPRNTKCLRLGGSSMRILNFYTSEEQREERALKHSVPDVHASLPLDVSCNNHHNYPVKGHILLKSRFAFLFYYKASPGVISPT